MRKCRTVAMETAFPDRQGVCVRVCTCHHPRLRCSLSVCSQCELHSGSENGDWRICADAQEEKGAHPSDRHHGICSDRSHNGLPLLPVHQIRCYIKQVLQPRALGQTRPDYSTETRHH